MSKKIWIDAGHFNNDMGFVSKQNIKEAEETKKIRDALKPLLVDYEVIYVPDALSLKETIEFINNIATTESFAISIHLNSNSNTLIRGTEAYYYSGPRYAEVFSRHVATTLGIPNRGAKPDTQTAVGSLGFLRLLKCPSVLAECAYMTNEADMERYTPQKAAQGIKNAIEELFPIQKRETNILVEIIRSAIALAQKALLILQRK